MFDLYIDNISLREIQVKHNEQILLFQNKEKEEMVALNISEAELLNILCPGGEERAPRDHTK